MRSSLSIPLISVPGPLPAVNGDPGIGVSDPVELSRLNPAIWPAFDRETNKNWLPALFMVLRRYEGPAFGVVAKGEPAIGESDPSEATANARIPPFGSLESEA